MLDGIISDTVLIKNGLGEILWPELGINQIGTWNPHDGYQLYMANAVTLTVSGSVISPETTPLDLPESWSLIGYLREGPMPIETALASIDGLMILVKNKDGEVYWPAFGVDQIHDMQPGQGYQLYMSAPGTLTYPAN